MDSQTYNLTRIFDVLISTILMFVTAPILAILFVLGIYNFKNPILSQVRVGYRGDNFKLYKFRSMGVSTEHVPSHKLITQDLTTYGKLIRKFKLDELPQLYNVLLGDMSLVGPRPCLPSQSVLIELRQKNGIYQYKPGITGLAQINNIDMSTPKLLVDKELEMIVEFSIRKYIFYLYKTLIGKGRGDSVKM